MYLEVLAPKADITRRITCEHPTKIMGEISDLLQKIYKIKSAQVFEDDIKWDVSGSMTEFYGKWRAREGKDKYSKVWCSITVMGEFDPKTKIGTIEIKLKSHLEVKIKCQSIVEEGLKWVYLKTFYTSQIHSYIEDANKKIIRLDNELREMLGVVKVKT